MTSLPRELGQLATKADLAVAAADIKSEVVRTLVFAMLASNATLVGLVVAAVKLG